MSGGFLNWDDPWLIVDNPVLRRADLAALTQIWTDFGFETRLALGAEYLPLRDSSWWLEARLWGLEPQYLRCSNLCLYAAAVLFLRAALRRALQHVWLAEITIWLFALHPAHVESVAWLAGRKDVLALLFVSLALWVQGREGRASVVLVPLLCALAQLSKSVAIVAIVLLAACDVLQRRRFRSTIYVGTAVVALAVLLLALQVGASMGMSGAPAGGSRWTAAMTMGPVWLRYLWLLIWPPALSIVQDVPLRTTWNLAGLLGYAVVLGSCVASFYWYWRTRNLGAPRSDNHKSPGGLSDVRNPPSSLAFVSCLWLWVPLLPVSQLLFPLQNRMADRYLLFSVLGLALLTAAGSVRWPRTLGPVTVLILIAFAGATLERALLFTDSTLVFADATTKTHEHPIAPYQLAQALEERGDETAARAAYQDTLRRDGLQANTTPSEAGRRATNNLAKLYARRGANSEAETLLRAGRARWPNDPKILMNLAEIVARQGRAQEASQLTTELHERFPNVSPGIKGSGAQ